MHAYYFTLHISRSDYLRYYQGSAARVIVKAQDGRSLSLPAANLRPFVSHEGIHGTFRLIVNDQQRLQSLERWPPSPPGTMA